MKAGLGCESADLEPKSNRFELDGCGEDACPAGFEPKLNRFVAGDCVVFSCAGAGLAAGFWPKVNPPVLCASLEGLRARLANGLDAAGVCCPNGVLEGADVAAASDCVLVGVVLSLASIMPESLLPNVWLAGWLALLDPPKLKILPLNPD